MPARKRSKPNPTATETLSSPSVSSLRSNASLPATATSQTGSAISTTIKKQSSWYGTLGRTYRSSAASTEVTKIEVTKDEESTGSQDPPPVLPSPLYLGKSRETTKLTLPDGNIGADKMGRSGKSTGGSQKNDIAAPTETGSSDLKIISENAEQSPAQAPATSSGLFSYISIPSLGGWVYTQRLEARDDGEIPAKADDIESDISVKSADEISKVSQPQRNEEESKTSGSWLWRTRPSSAVVTNETFSDPPPTITIQELSVTTPSVIASARSPGTAWYNILSSRPLDSQPKDTQALINTPENRSNSPTPEKDIPKFKDGSQPASNSTWGFYSRVKRGDNGSSTQTGTLAISGDPSEDNPEPATLTSPQKPKESVARQSPPSDHLRTPEAVYGERENHILLPRLHETFKSMEDPSIIQQLARLMRLTRGPPPSDQVVSLVKTPMKIKRAVAIGVHGVLPPWIVQTIVGETTGTSNLFAAHAAASIRRWTQNQGYECDIDKLVLHYDGQVSERVDQLWKILLFRIADIERADLVVFACHSQGVPVSVMLAARLVDLGIMTSTRIGFCAMAGVNLGPFLNLQTVFTRFAFSRSTGFELFNFADAESDLSKMYIESLRKVLRFGARITYIGSMDDQLVSMESSTFTPLHHPYVYRAVFADGKLYKPDFLVKLIGFALKLRNMGVRDHGLIRELSLAIQGPSHPNSKGHSILYDDPKVYDLALQFTLETTSIRDVDLIVNPYCSPALSTDQYILPFAIRGVLDEELAKTELSKEARELLDEFDAWKPNTPLLLSVKERLRAIKSML